MKKLLKKYLFGITLPEEYICVAREEVEKPQKTYLQLLDNSRLDISDNQLMLGYKPLIIGLYANQHLNLDQLSKSNHLNLLFGPNQEDIIAGLKMSLVKSDMIGSHSFLILKGEHGEHQFANSFQKKLKNLFYNLTTDRKKNVFLDGNLYDQVKMAYSVPRIIYLVTLAENEFYNVFPTDISGKINDDFFAISLRTTGKANQQLGSLGKCIISEMHTNSYKYVYKLGRNHMRDLADVRTLEIDLNTSRSKNLNLLIPKDALRYYELLTVDKKIEIGLHTIHFFKIINSEKLNYQNSTLAHIHRDYAEWRIKNNLNTDFLFRKN